MKKYSCFLSALVIYSILTSSGGTPTPPWSKENISFPMMNQEIRHSMQENERQKEMRSKQTTNALTENVNKKWWEDLKLKVTKVQDRLRIVSFAIQSVPTGIAITREINKIIKNQEDIIREIDAAPWSIVVALPSQVQFVNDLQMNIRLMTGLILSYGAINQMEKAERKILLDYAQDEIKTLRRNSSHMLFMVREIKLQAKRKKSLFDFYVNRDKNIVDAIMKNIKTF